MTLFLTKDKMKMAPSFYFTETVHFLDCKVNTQL